MASLDTLVTFTAIAGSPPATRYATLDTFADGSTPTLTHLVLDFDPGATTEFVDFIGVMPGQYDGSSALEVVLHWSSDATSGAVKWDVSFKSVTDDADDLETHAPTDIGDFNITIDEHDTVALLQHDQLRYDRNVCTLRYLFRSPPRDVNHDIPRGSEQ